MGLSQFSLADRVAIVTGSGQGIGRGIALAFADAGADIVVTGIDIYDPSHTDVHLEVVATEIRSRGRKALVIPADFRLSDEVDNMVQKAVEGFGGIDILVNNVGGTFYVPFLQMSEHAWDAIIRESLKTTFLCTKAVATVMVEQKRGGSIVNISSGSGVHAAAEQAHYGAAKAGVINLTKSLALELAPHKIRVNAIAPGLILHEGLERRRRSGGMHREERERVASRIPLGRAGRPEDIGAAAIYLASDAASFVTGITLSVDGGSVPGG